MDINIKNKLNESIEKCFNMRFLNYEKEEQPNSSLLSIVDSYELKNNAYFYPIGVFWQITSSCNLRCKHCFYYKKQDKFDNKEDLSIDELLKLAEIFIEELNVISFTITGGEPFCQKDILKLLKYLKSKNVYIQIQTNATLITPEMANELGKILNSKMDSIQVSLDGANEITNDKIRGKNAFSEAIEGINNLVNNKINVLISYTVTSQNVNELLEFYNLCKKLKIQQINLGRFTACSSEQLYLKPSTDELFLSLASLIDSAQKDNSVVLNMTKVLQVYDYLNYEIGIKLLDEYSLTNKIPCPENLVCHNHGKINVCGDGSIYLCPSTENKELCLGNIKKDSFFKLWENRYNNLFFQYRGIEKLVCKDCKYISICHAGCPAKAYKEYGDINAPDGECAYGKKLVAKQKENRGNYVR